MQKPEGEPDYVTVQHCLISFRDTEVRAPRSKEEAEKLALELFEKAKAGEDFDEMVKAFTDDSPPGIYRMANFGVEATSKDGSPTYGRGGMVAAFGDVGFPLEVGEYGLAPFDPAKSKYGWHIIKRIE